MGTATGTKIKNTVGIVVEPYEEKRASGLAYATLEEVRGLQEIMQDVDFLLYAHSPIQKERVGLHARWVRVPRSFVGKNLWFLWHALIGSEHLPDVLLFNMPLLPLILPKKIATLPIAYEVAFFSRDASFVKTLGLKIKAAMGGWALRRAQTIVVPSHATETDLRNAYRQLTADVVYIPLGYRVFTDIDVSCVPAHSYFLYVGAVKYKKNVHRMLEAFCDFKDAFHTDHQFVLAGKSGGEYTEKLKKYAVSRGYGDDLLFLGYTYGDQLGGLYAKAEALLFCTLQEGFGMPIIEAMAVGTPVITSNISSQDEVGGDASARVNPEQPKEITKAMVRVTQDVSFRDELIRRGRVRAQVFSWERHCKDLAETIKALL